MTPYILRLKKVHIVGLLFKNPHLQHYLKSMKNSTKLFLYEPKERNTQLRNHIWILDMVLEILLKFHSVKNRVLSKG